MRAELRGRKQFLSFLFCLVKTVALVEAIDTTGGVNQFLLTCKEGVAGRTNFNVDVLYG